LAGADDAQIRIEKDKDGTIKATVEHAKDFESGAVLAFKLESVELGCDRDGDPITSCVVTAMEADEKAKDDEQDDDPSEQKMSKTTKLALDVLRKLLASSIDSITAPAEIELPHGARVCRVKRWRELFCREMAGDNQDSKRRAFKRAQETAGRVRDHRHVDGLFLAAVD
jgi:hypothetical protein